MPETKQKSHDSLRTYIFHGIDFKDDGRQAVGNCPFCGKKGKFSVEIASTKFKCFNPSCAKLAGNSQVFLRQYYNVACRVDQKALETLAKDRKLLSWESLKEWGVKVSPRGEIIVPGYNASGVLMTLYRYLRNPKTGKRYLNPTPGHGQHLGGVNLYDKNKPKVVYLEGFWDGVAYWEVLSRTKETNNVYAPTGSKSSSLLKNINVITVPGAGTFSEQWGSLCKDKDTTFLYDSDHPKKNGEQEIAPIGWSGMCHAVETLHIKADDKPKSIQVLRWGPDGYDEKLPSGYDVRDALTRLPDIDKRIDALEALEKRIEEVPEEWLQGSEKSKGSMTLGIEAASCDNYKDVINALRKCLNLTPRHDLTLSAMLATGVSTKASGTAQLWLRVIGPPSCLHGDTPIYDPIQDDVMTVRKRCKIGKPFHVWSMIGGGRVGPRAAFAPQNQGTANLYKVFFESGRSIIVTLGHRFYVGGPFNEYKSLKEIMPWVNPRREDRNGSVPSVSDWDIRETFNEDRGLEECPNGSGIVIDRKRVRTYGDKILAIEFVGADSFYDFHVPETNNYWACGFFHHNSGKSTLCEALAVSKHVFSKSTIKGLFSAYKTDKEGKEDNSLIPKLKDKTFIVKDADSLMKAPNVAEIMSQFRDSFDKNTRMDARNGISRDYLINFTAIFAGTGSIQALDQSDLGERFLSCRIVEDEHNDDLEDDIALRVAYRANANMSLESNGKAESMTDPKLVTAMQLCGGYLNYLRENAKDLLSQTECSTESMMRIIHMAQLVSYLRARPPKGGSENVEKEWSARLVEQFMRLAKCLAVVLNKTEVDEEVLNRCHKVCEDTCRGRVLHLARFLYSRGSEGAEVKFIALATHHTDSSEREMLRFLKRIGAVESFEVKDTNGKLMSSKVRWRLTERVRKLYRAVMVPVVKEVSSEKL